MLWFLPGERYIFHDKACQENNPCGNGGQFYPKITGFFAMEAGQCPTQGFFAKVDARLNRPTGNICPSNRFDGHMDLCRIQGGASQANQIG